ncbi:MAG: hemerythrin [Ferrimonas sp.]
MLARIAHDHHQFSQVLCLFELQVVRLQQGAYCDMMLLHEAVAYLHHYADQQHHPLEDEIYQYYLEVLGEDEGAVHQLRQEHLLISQITEAILATLALILSDHVVPRQQLTDRLLQFVALQRAHLLYEDKELLPRITARLTQQDWHELANRCGRLPLDPLLDDRVEAYTALQEALQQ